jgi:hypothetical protein
MSGAEWPARCEVWGWLRVFVDEGPPMATLLHQLLAGRRQEQLAAAGAAPREYLARLTDAFEQAGPPIRPPVGRGGVAVAGWWSR